MKIGKKILFVKGKRATLRKKFDAVKNLIDKELRGEIDLPKRVVVYTLTDKEISSLITKERLRLIKTISKYNPKSIKELAEILKRKIPAVDRDVNLLIKHEILSTKKSKKGVQPILAKDAIILPLVEPKKLTAMASQ